MSDGMGAGGGGVSEAMKAMIANKVDKIDLDEIKYEVQQDGYRDGHAANRDLA